MNRKGSGIDLIEIGVVATILTIVVIFGSLIWGKVNGGLIASGSFNEGIINKSETMRLRITSYIDYAVPTLVVAIGLGTIILARYINAHPIWYIFAILLIVMGIFIGVVMKEITSNVMENNQEIYNIYKDMSITKWFIGHLPIIIFVFGVAMVIVMYIFRD